MVVSYPEIRFPKFIFIISWKSSIASANIANLPWFTALLYSFLAYYFSLILPFNFLLLISTSKSIKAAFGGNAKKYSTSISLT